MLALGLVGAIVVVVLSLFALASVLAAGERAAQAADSAALAAADALSGASPGQPCDEAARVAAASDVRIIRCAPRALDVRVVVSCASPWGAVSARARAGPPRATAPAGDDPSLPETPPS